MAGEEDWQRDIEARVRRIFRMGGQVAIDLRAATRSDDPNEITRDLVRRGEDAAWRFLAEFPDIGPAAAPAVPAQAGAVAPPVGLPHAYDPGQAAAAASAGAADDSQEDDSGAAGPPRKRARLMAQDLVISGSGFVHPPLAPAAAVGITDNTTANTVPVGTVLAELPHEHLLAKLARGIPKATEGSNSVTLPDGIGWPDLDSDTLYKRHFYKDLWEKVLRECRSEKGHRGAAILGTPGIAKSAFGLYALYQAVKAGRTVIYSALKGGTAVFKEGRAFDVVGKLDSAKDLIDVTALYISDAKRPVPFGGAFRLLITSPKKDTWREFAKSPGNVELVLPMFSRDEILELRALAFSDVAHCTEAEVLQRFELWGGSARNVLTYGSNRNKQGQLAEEAGAATIEVLEKALQYSTALDGVAESNLLHRFVSMVPRGAAEDNLATSDSAYYAFHHAEPISSHVLSIFTDSVNKRDKAKLYRFLHQSSAVPALGSFRGNLYERCIVLPRLKNGTRTNEQGSGQLSLVRLTGETAVEKPAWLQVASLDFTQGLPSEDIKAEELEARWNGTTDNRLFVLPRGFPVVDFIVRINGLPLLINATVGCSHNIKVDNPKFATVLSAVGLKTNAEIPLVWVLDRPAFDGFHKPGPMESASGSILTSGPTACHVIGRRLAQYKLLLPIPSAASNT